MAPPFRIGVMQLTMEPLEEMLASARVMDEAGIDTIWLAEAYPWWRKQGMDARIVQEAAGAGRFLLGYGTSKIFLNNIKRGGEKVSTLGAMRDAVAITR